MVKDLIHLGIILLAKLKKDFLVCSNNKFFVTHHPTSYPKKEQLISKSLKDVYKDLGQYLKSLT